VSDARLDGELHLLDCDFKQASVIHCFLCLFYSLTVKNREESNSSKNKDTKLDNLSEKEEP
jgi:hypothetical protein